MSILICFSKKVSMGLELHLGFLVNCLVSKKIGCELDCPCGLPLLQIGSLFETNALEHKVRFDAEDSSDPGAH
jgi:hypothetical protein